MAQPAATPKIEELRFRLKTDPKSRLFFPLAEELRKAGQQGEAEQVLRHGLSMHQTYLSAWVSLGRVLRDQHKDFEAVEALTHALQLDPGNVVAARLLADAYLALGEKVEAIKKYKLVHALMPGDEELENTIATIEREIGGPLSIAEPATEEPAAEAAAPFAEEVAAPAEEPLAAFEVPVTAFEQPVAGPIEEPIAETIETPLPVAEQAVPPALEEEPEPEIAAPPIEVNPFADDTAARQAREAPAAFAAPSPTPFDDTLDTPFAEAAENVREEAREGVETGDAEPMSAEHEVSPFEEPLHDYTSAALEVESPGGMHIGAAPLGAEVPSPFEEEVPTIDTPIEIPAGLREPHPEPQMLADARAAEPFAVDEASAPQEIEEPTNTVTMADLYARQGLVTEAKQIYENILARDPENEDVRAKLAAVEPPAHSTTAKVAKLEQWLQRVGRKEGNDV